MPRAGPEAAPAAVRDAATLILVRRDGPEPRVLMGQRGAAAAFMPDKFVFPGGAVEAGDLDPAVAFPADPATAAALAVEAAPEAARALPLAAIRELWEETGLRLGAPEARAAERAADAPAAWRGFLAAGLRPRAEALAFVFRAVTPPGRPRRFDARFFLAEAVDLADPPDAVTQGDSELVNLRWLALAEARSLPLPFVTAVVLAEIEAALAEPALRRPAPFFRHDARGSHVTLIGVGQG